MLGLWGPRAALGFGGTCVPHTAQALSEESLAVEPGARRAPLVPPAFNPFPPPLPTCQSPRARGGEAEGGSLSHRKQALDTIQASPRQGPHTPASLAPGLANGTCSG